MTSIVVNDEENFSHILRVLNTNIKGKDKVGIAITAIKGIGRRYANIVLKRANIDLNRRAGELSEEEIEKVVSIINEPQNYNIPEWFLNRRKDPVEGTYSQLVSNLLDGKLREDLERLKKILCNRGLRNFWGIRVRGQKTCTTGRRGKTVGVSKKKA